jgi:hypothetical protein
VRGITRSRPSRAWSAGRLSRRLGHRGRPARAQTRPLLLLIQRRSIVARRRNCFDGGPKKIVAQASFCVTGLRSIAYVPGANAIHTKDADRSV